MKTKTYRVTRFCCLSGCCIECNGQGNPRRRIRVVQADRLTVEKAAKFKKGWKDYGAEIEEESPS